MYRYTLGLSADMALFFSLQKHMNYTVESQGQTLLNGDKLIAGKAFFHQK